MAVKGIRTIVVDDSESIRSVMKASLNELDITDLTCCENGSTALSLIQQDPTPYDLIFVDLNMPEMDGMALIRHLGEAHFNGAVVIASEMESRVINLASDIAKQNHIHLIGNLKKPIHLDKLKSILERYQVFHQRLVPASKQLSCDEIRQAISEHRLMPYYQPQINIKNQKIHSIEVLARIDSKGKGQTILPESFIPVAENHKLIDIVTDKLLETALSEFKELQEQVGYTFLLAFNLSAIQLEDLSIPDRLSALLEKFSIKPSQIIVEVTEEYALESDRQLETLNRLRIKGYGVALDDFGTGFTNIKQLLNLPFSEIKIDRSLVSGIASDHFSQVIVNSMIDLTSKMGVTLVAEGIESMAELEYFEKFKALILLQGYIFTKPKPKNELIRWHHGWQKALHLKKTK